VDALLYDGLQFILDHVREAFHSIYALLLALQYVDRKSNTLLILSNRLECLAGSGTAFPRDTTLFHLGRQWIAGDLDQPRLMHRKDCVARMDAIELRHAKVCFRRIAVAPLVSTDVVDIKNTYLCNFADRP